MGIRPTGGRNLGDQEIIDAWNRRVAAELIKRIYHLSLERLSTDHESNNEMFGAIPTGVRLRMCSLSNPHDSGHCGTVVREQGGAGISWTSERA